MKEFEIVKYKTFEGKDVTRNIEKGSTIKFKTAELAAEFAKVNNTYFYDLYIINNNGRAFYGYAVPK